MGLMLFIHVVRKEDSCVVKSYGLLKESEWIALAIFLNTLHQCIKFLCLNSPQLCRHVAVVCIDLWCSAGVYFRSYFSCTVEKCWFIFLLQKWLTTNAFQEPGPVNQPQTCSWDSIKLIGHTVQLQFNYFSFYVNEISYCSKTNYYFLMTVHHLHALILIQPLV